NLPIDEFSVSFTEHQPMYGLLRRLTTLGKPSAIFVANESLGLEATYILQNVLNVRVPQEISLLGMESPQVSQFLSPPMTTLAQPLEELAEKSLSLLLRQIRKESAREPGNSKEPECIVLENRLIERESVATISDG